MRYMPRAVVRTAATLALVLVGASSSACDNPAACDRDQVRYPYRNGVPSDLQKELNYWRLGYVNDADILDEFNRRIGVYRLCTRCW